MKRDKMPQSEQFECAEVMHDFRDLLQKAWRDDLPRVFFVNSPEVAREKARFAVFLRLGLVDEVWKVKDDFGKVVSEVMGNRTIDDLTYMDYEVVASRYREWYPHNRLSSGWHIAGYNLRSAVTRG